MPNLGCGNNNKNESFWSDTIKSKIYYKKTHQKIANHPDTSKDSQPSVHGSVPLKSEKSSLSFSSDNLMLQQRIIQ